MPHLELIEDDNLARTIDVATANVAALKQIWTAESKERKHAARLLRMASGDQISMIRMMPHETDEHFERKPKYSPNLLGVALEKVSSLYAEEPLREQDNDAAQSWAEPAFWNFGLGLSLVMAHVDRLVRIQGAALMHPVYKHHLDAPSDFVQLLQGFDVEQVEGAQDGVEIVAIPRHRFAVLPNPFDARVPEAVLVCMSSRIEVASNGAANTITQWQYWDSKVVAILEDDGFSGDPKGKKVGGALYHEHGIGDLPFAVARNSELGMGFYPETFGIWGGTDLSENVRTIAELLSELAHTTILQRGQIYTTGADPKNIVLAPDSILELPAGGTAGSIQNGADLAGMMSVVARFLDYLALTLHLPARTFKLEFNAAMSGIAIIVDEGVLEKDRQKREKLARVWERRADAKAKAVYNNRRGTSLDGTVAVMFRPVVHSLTEEQKLARLQFEISNGLIAGRDAIRELHPELTEEQIDGRIERIQAEGVPSETTTR